MTTLKALPSDTIRLIGSTQVITSVSNAIKELVENSIDAGATNIQVKLENYGLDRIEIRDNGCGIKSENFPFLAKRHCTSKICHFTDLEHLVTYGFRGEALASLCSVSDLTVTSRTSSNSVAQTATFTKSGDVLKITPCSSNEGSTIVASGLFKNLPVRHQFNRNDKRCKEELKKVENLITAFSIINPATRFTLRHNKEILLEKGAVDSYRSALIATWGWSLVQQFEHIVNTDEEHQISLEMFLPQTKSDVNVMSRTGTDQGLVYINRRPVRFKAIQKAVRQYYCNSLDGDKNRYPLFVAIFTVSNREVDVNLEPNKARVLLHNEDIILDILTSLLEQLYGVLGSGNQVTKNGSNHTSAETKPKTENQVVHCPKNNKPVPEKTDPNGIELLPLSTLLQPQTRSPSGLTNGDLHSVTEKHNFSSNSTSLPKPAESDTAPTLPVNQPVVTPHHPAPLQHVPLPVAPLPTAPLPTAPLPAASSSSSLSCTALDREELFKEFDKSFEIEFTDPGSNGGKSLLQQQQQADRGQPQTTSEPQLPLPGPLDLEEWSRGKVSAQNGNILQPVRLLSPAAGQISSKPQTIPQLNPPTTTASTPQHPLPLQAKKKPFLPKPANQMRLYDLVGSQPIKRPVTAFNMFFNETRAKLLQKDAEINADVLRATIITKWQRLPESEKTHYEKLCETDLKRYEDQMNAAKSVALNKLKQEKLKSPIPKKSVQSVNADEARRFPVKYSNIPFSLKTLKRKFSNVCNESQSNDDYVPVGILSQGDTWICQQGTHVFLLNPHRINEVIIYRRLLESFQFQTRPLETPIDINESLLGDVNLWRTLLSLETEQEKEMLPGFQKITDHRIVANGFHIVIFTEQGSSPEVKQVQLRGVADSIPTYGIGDLGEVLENIASLPESSSLAQCRPLKILNYLKGEAVRMARKSPLFSCREEITELLESSKRLKTSECLHSRPFFQELYDISSLPFSQTTFTEESQLSLK